jgi:hypothetical protein
MSYYNQITHEERTQLPTTIETSVGIICGATSAELKAEGWVLTEVVPFVIPEGFAIIPGTRAIYMVGEYAQEHYDKELITVKEARDAAALLAEENAKWTPARLQSLALFVITLQRNFGAGAETNQEISQANVTAHFIGKRQAQTLTLEELADSMILSTLYAELAPLCPDGTTWTAPYWRLG